MHVQYNEEREREKKRDSVCGHSVAPNVLTFTATLTFVYAYCVFQFYCDDLQKCAPPFVYFQLAICLFIYQTLDAIDGKQARRTKSSSPLGQLFDHGNDAFAFTPMVIAGMGCAGYVHVPLLSLSTKKHYTKSTKINKITKHYYTKRKRQSDKLFCVFSIRKLPIINKNQQKPPQTTNLSQKPTNHPNTAQPDTKSTQKGTNHFTNHPIL